MRIDPADALSTYVMGSVVLGRVVDLSSRQADVELYPDVVVPLSVEQVTDNPLDALTDLMSIGETLAARVIESGIAPTSSWRLGILDVDDDDDALPAPALLLGGPPWLVLPATGLPTAPATGPDVAREIVVPRKSTLRLSCPQPARPRH